MFDDFTKDQKYQVIWYICRFLNVALILIGGISAFACFIATIAITTAKSDFLPFIIWGVISVLTIISGIGAYYTAEFFENNFKRYNRW